jgi:hypothetical protein
MQIQMPLKKFLRRNWSSNITHAGLVLIIRLLPSSVHWLASVHRPWSLQRMWHEGVEFVYSDINSYVTYVWRLQFVWWLTILDVRSNTWLTHRRESIEILLVLHDYFIVCSLTRWCCNKISKSIKDSNSFNGSILIRYHVSKETSRKPIR